ncbi:MAG: hypothetical protein CMG05_02405 [Candidatus Marinimicrobia bacterium]|nr:hypothetical protein [Candidatus Neomarinimicrobiota bacterium]
MILNKKHIVFDWNGTLIDDAWIFVDILNSLLKNRNLNQIDLNKYQEMFCFPLTDFYQNLGFDVNPDAFNILKEDFVFEYNKRQFSAHLFPDAVDTLNKIKSHNVKLSILSASNQKILSSLMNFYSINHYFTHILGVDNYEAAGKEKLGFKLLNFLGESRSDIVMVGDTDLDYRVSQKLGIDCILISRGHQSHKRLSVLDCPVIYSLTDLLE